MTDGGTGFRVELLPTTDSTNRVCVERARGGERAGLVVVADEQTAGRGRQGRAWVSGPGDGLYVSLLRRPDVPAAEAWRWTLVAGLATLAIAPPGAWLKWPNDVLVGDRKLAGILCELVTEGADVAAVVVGIGVNLQPPPPPLNATAAHLDGVSRDDALAGLLAAFAELEPLARTPALLDRARAAMAPMFGRPATAEIGREVVDVEVVGLADSGGLEVLVDGLRRRVLLAGDVHLRRDP